MNKKICVIGLGYVGLPLSVEFAKKYLTCGFDINMKRVKEINALKDSTLEIKSDILSSLIIKSKTVFDKSSTGLFCTDKLDDIRDADIYIITVPTPVDNNKNPLLEPLINATKTVSKVLQKGNIVIYESTVFPGATEEICKPIIEKETGLIYNKDFYLGYSPERINPGDKERTISKIVKVTSGSNDESAHLIDDLYKSIISAGTFLATSIKVAEAAKVIENSQRDINIAFVNELAKIFGKLEIDTNDVLEAASTKWNFLNFKPGLVGGHCIGVDPYYLAQKAQQVGYHPEIILSGRRINDSMGEYVTSQIIKLMIRRGLSFGTSKVLIMGITFKENCPDIRNSGVINIINEFKKYNIYTEVYDPWACEIEVKKEYQINLVSKISNNYDVIIHAVAHSEFTNFDFNLIKSENGFIYDIKGVLEKSIVSGRL